MVIVKLMGGLGNQMFQYALGRHLSYKCNTELKLDLSYLLDRTPRAHFVFRSFDLDIFNIKAHFSVKDNISRHAQGQSDQSSSFTDSASGCQHISEPFFHFSPDVLEVGDNVYLDGYWQSEKYFYAIESIIREDFSFKKKFNSKCLNIYDNIVNSNSVCLHVRRSDYVNNPNSSSVNGFCGLDYYKRAISAIENKTDQPHYIIFSDDIEWCMTHFAYLKDKTFFTEDDQGKDINSCLQLMSQCKHHIIANSTFSWWAAWLNTNKEKCVIAPKKWFKTNDISARDLVPDTWMRA